MRLIISMMLLILMSGCAQKDMYHQSFKEANCTGWRPIMLNIGDTERTKQQVENHNDFYFSQCSQ